MSDTTQAPAKRPYNRRPPVRAAEVRPEPVRAEEVRPTKKVRTRRGTGTDWMYIAPERIPEGIDLQWNTDTVLGQPAIQETMQMQQQGWEPVTVGMFDGRFDHMMPKGHKGQITYGAARLDWRPLELTLEARGEERQAAKAAINTHETKLRAGQVDGVTLDTDHPRARAVTKVQREILPGIPVPKD